MEISACCAQKARAQADNYTTSFVFCQVLFIKKIGVRIFTAPQKEREQKCLRMSAPHGNRTRLTTIKSRVHNRYAKGAYGEVT